MPVRPAQGLILIVLGIEENVMNGKGRGGDACIHDLPLVVLKNKKGTRQALQGRCFVPGNG